MKYFTPLMLRLITHLLMVTSPDQQVFEQPNLTWILQGGYFVDLYDMSSKKPCYAKFEGPPPTPSLNIIVSGA